jgi:3,4-dihydroxy 2-butanone 4-phosphate synthase / GTP cyclohydrolase II
MRDEAHSATLSILVEETTSCRSGRGIMMMAGTGVSASDINAMARFARGVISVALRPDRAHRLGLRSMARETSQQEGPHFLASVEAVACTETGISARERALTAQTLSDPVSTAGDLVSPGHILPLIVPDRRRGEPTLPEYALLMAGADGAEAVVWCDILDEDGDVASSETCAALAEQLRLPCHVANRSAVDASVMEWQIAV